MEKSTSLDVDLLVDDPDLSKCAFRSIKNMVSEPNVRISHVIENTSNVATPDGLLYTLQYYANSIREYGAWAPIEGFYSKINPPEYLRNTSLKDHNITSDAVWLQTEPVAYDGLGHALPSQVVNEVKDIDILVRFGFGILRGDILDAAQYGVLSFHHGDIRKYRGRPT